MKKMEIKNRKANFDYFIEKTLECGIELLGTEVKSIRNGNANIKDSFAKIKNNELFLINMYIGKYDQGNFFNHDERKTRKLLVHKKEILKLNEYTMKEGYTLIPLEVYFKNNKVKVNIGICKGKHTYDKRASLKEKELKKEENYV